MRPFSAVAALSTAIAGLAACTITPAEVVVPDLAGHHSPAAKPWTSLEVLDDADRFHFAVVTDRTGGEREGVFPVGVEKVNLVQPAFVMSVGDLIEGYTEDESVIADEWDEFSGMVEALDAPFFYVAGNHDYMNIPMENAWKARFGASYYHFVYKDVLFLILNSELMDIPKGTPDRTGGPAHGDWYDTDERRAARDDQFAYIEEVLADNAEVRWTFVFLHKPFWRKGWLYPPTVEGGNWNDFDLTNYPVDGPYPINETENADWTGLEALLSDRDYTAFAGHRHSYAYENIGDDNHTHEHIALATTGGVSSLRGVTYGEFDQFMWVTMTDEGPVFANIALDGVQPKDFATPDAKPWWLED